MSMPSSMPECANVETLAYARKTPWHGFGHNNGETLMTAHEAIKLAGLDWTVSAENMQLQDGTATPFRALVRDTDRKIYGSCRDRYEIFQNWELADFAELITDMYGQPMVEVAGALNGGSRVFMVLKVSDLDVDFQFLTEQEKHDWYLFLRTTHDGSGATTAFPTGVRVVCQNTENMALSSKNKAKGYVSIRHTPNAAERRADAAASLGVVSRYAKTLDEMAARMAESQVEGELLATLMDTLIPIPEKRGQDKALEARDELRKNIFGSPTIPNELKGTRWGVFQGITEFFEHEADGRFWDKTPAAERPMLTNFTDNGAVNKARQAAWNILSF